MFLAEIKVKSDEDEVVLNLLYALMGTWRSNGQTLGEEFPLAEKEGLYRAFLMVPQTDSLDERYDNEYSKRTRNELLQLTSMETQILGEDPESSDACRCLEPSFYILFTHYLTRESPLRCGDCFAALPLYTLNEQVSSSEKSLDGVRGWQSNYQACDTLQMGCSTGERFGEREMSQLSSSLTKRGREICNTISEATKTPTFYYLHRARGRSDKLERQRNCPSCGDEWLLEESLHDKFDFKCDNCRLLSNVAFSIG